MNRVIYVELDGCLVEQGTMKPIDPVVSAIKGALANGDEVILVSQTRGADHAANGAAKFTKVDRLMIAMFGDSLSIVDEIGADMTEFWSHRVVQYEVDTGRRMVPRKGFGG